MSEAPDDDVTPAGLVPSDEHGATGRIAGIRRRASDLRQKAADLEAQAQVRLEVEQERRTWVRTLVLAYQADRNRGGNLIAGGIAYRLFLWQLPAILFLVSLLGVVSNLSSQDPSDMARSSGMSAALASVIASAVNEAGSARWWLLLVGAVLTIWAGRSAVRGLQVSAQIAWQRREPSLPSGLKASLSFTAFLFAVIALPFLSDALLSEGIGPAIAGWVVVTLAYAAIVTWGMTLLPHGARAWTAVLPGALSAVLLIRVGVIFAQLYLSKRLEEIDDLYGAMGIAIVALLWLYIVARAFVGANFLNATASGVPVGRLDVGPSGALDPPG